MKDFGIQRGAISTAHGKLWEMNLGGQSWIQTETGSFVASETSSEVLVQPIF
jgi:hypothetical protein